MRIQLRSILMLLLCVGIISAAYGGQWVPKTFEAKSYSGSRDRHYQIYVPDAYQEGEPVPMVMVLHGCQQTEQNMIDETRFRELADQENFIVVYPFITSYDGLRNPNCWGFFLDQHIREGAGEAEDLYQLALEVESEYTIDPERRYITGLSSGAGMAVVMAVTQNEYFAAAGAAAGLPYSETSRSVGFVCANPGRFKSIPAVVAAMQAEQRRPEEARAIPLMTIHSNNDCTVNRQGSVNIRDSWIQHYGASPTAYETTDCTAEGVPCTHLKFGTPERSVVETVFYEGERGSFTGEGSHYWVGDHSGQFANPTGPSATELFWNFFNRHAFTDNLPPSIAIAFGSAEGTAINLTGTAADADGTVAEVAVALISKDESFETQVTLERRDSRIVDWSASSASLPDNAFYTPVATATDDQGATSRITGEPIAVGTPPKNPPAITIDKVSVNGNCITVAGTAADSDGTITKVEVKLGERGFEPATDFREGRYTQQTCNLPAGTYTTLARATDNDGLTTSVSGERVEVSDLEVAVAHWQDHLSARRLRVYGAPCPNVGFGACDVDFATIFLRFSFSPFSLYRNPAANDWYLDPDKISGARARTLQDQPQDQPPELTITDMQIHDRDCVTITGTATDDSAVASVAVSLDGGEFAAVELAGNSWPFNQCGLSEGLHTVRVRVRDDADPPQEALAETSFMIE